MASGGKVDKFPIIAYLYDKECPVDFYKENLGYFSFYGYISQWAIIL